MLSALPHGLIAALKLIRWRAGATTTVEITLQNMGAYSATAPYNCPKSSLILQQGLQAIMATTGGETTGRYSFSLLTLLAANNPSDPANAARMTRAQNEARARIPNATTRTQMMSDARDATSMVTWERGHTLVALAEYYLVTRDTQILPAAEALRYMPSASQAVANGVQTVVVTLSPEVRGGGRLFVRVQASGPKENP